MKKRGFEIVSRYQGMGLNIPKRQTKGAAGYDFEAAEDFEIPSIWRLNFVRIFRLIKNGHKLTKQDEQLANETLRPFLVPTGIKAYMGEDEYLMLANRSSNPIKRQLILPNGIGIIDSDYYGNENNEGEIFIQVLNFGPRTLRIKKGERIGQGIFMPYLTVDDESNDQKERTGGFGSSGE